MKKIIYLLMIIPIVFASCEVEKMDDSYGLESTDGKGKIKAAQDFNWADPSECSYSVTDLIAGQNMVVGTVTVTSDGINYTITYNVDAGYCLTETHLSVVKDPNDFPMTNSGNPKNGHFEYSDYYDCGSNEPFTVPVSRGSYIAAHGVVNCKSQSLEEIEANFPETIDEFCTTTQGPDAYLNISVSDGFLSGKYGAWCVDDDSSIELGICYDNAELFASTETETLPALAFENPGNFDKVNWLLNQGYVGNGYTYGDLQFAIWTLVDDASCTEDCGLGDWDPDRAAELVKFAMDNGGGFIPECGEYVGIILIPDGEIQPLIIPYPIECNDCEETVWAKGCDFPGNNWAMYFRYE